MSSKEAVRRLVREIREQVLFLQELGIDSLPMPLRASENLRVALNDQTPESSGVASDLPDTIGPAPVFPSTSSNAPEAPRPVSKLAGLPSLSKRGAAKLGGTDTASETADLAAVRPAGDLAESLFGDLGPTLPQTAETIDAIRADVGNCTRCPLHQGRTKIVHTTGNFRADLMFVGEAPGADEDAQGEPFVGRAGQLLNKIIEAIGLSRDRVCIGNINRCRPPGNRQPVLPEAQTCRPFLLREIAVIRPKVIVVLGNTALHNLLDTKVGITKIRGTFQDYFGVKVMPTFHPAFLLRDPSRKREVWDDMKKVRDYLASVSGC